MVLEVNLGVVTRNELEGVSVILKTLIWVQFTLWKFTKVYTKVFTKVYCILKFTLKYHIKCKIPAKENSLGLIGLQFIILV